MYIHIYIYIYIYICVRVSIYVCQVHREVVEQATFAVKDRKPGERSIIAGELLDLAGCILSNNEHYRFYTRDGLCNSIAIVIAPVPF